jgi:hypothetical protein
MPRRRVTPLFPIAISPSRLADVLEVSRDVIGAAITAGHLRVYQHGLARRILIEDVVMWIKTTWTIKQPKGTRHGERSSE